MDRRLMLDTQTLLWWFAKAPIKPEVQTMIDDAFNEVVVSAASIWELRIKQAKGRLEAAENMLVMLDAMEVDVLDITGEHAEHAARLPAHHGDPFDRMIVAQAIAEDYVLVTGDRRLADYGVPVLAAR